PRHLGRRPHRPRPYPPGEPLDARGADAAEHLGRPAALDHRGPAGQARQPDAVVRLRRDPSARPRRLPERAEVAMAVLEPGATETTRVERLERIWASRPGVLGWL